MFNFWKMLAEQKTVEATLPEDMTLEQVRSAMLQLLSDQQSQHYRMGQLFNHVVERKLAEAAGYKNAPDYFSQNVKEVSASALFMYGAVARAFSEEACSQFGVTRLHLLLIYKEAADLQVNHDAPGDTSIEVPREQGALTLKLFSACTVEELRQAIQRKRKPSSSKPVPPAEKALADQLSQAVKGSFPTGVVVKVAVRNQKGKAVLDFKGIPVEHLGKLVEVLSAGLPPVLPPEPELQRVAQVMPVA